MKISTGLLVAAAALLIGLAAYAAIVTSQLAGARTNRDTAIERLKTQVATTKECKADYDNLSNRFINMVDENNENVSSLVDTANRIAESNRAQSEAITVQSEKFAQYQMPKLPYGGDCIVRMDSIGHHVDQFYRGTYEKK